jgi:proline dehydrogenase
MENFENTEVAFKLRTQRELLQAYMMFKLISYPSLVRTGNFMIPLAVRTGIPLGWFIKPTVYRQFCGGETIEECTKVIGKLQQLNVKSILDYSVESKKEDGDMDTALQETLKTIRLAESMPAIAFAVFKPTAFISPHALEALSTGSGITPSIEEEGGKFRTKVEIMCAAAFGRGLPILIDAEDTCYQPFIDKVALEMMEKYNREKAIVFNTYQMYRADRLSVLEGDCSFARSKGIHLGAKFVRGAYMERERRRAAESGYRDPIHKDKTATDRDYNEALRFSVENIDVISIFNGTHNEQSSLLLVELMAQNGIARNDPRTWFSQLYGMSDHISFNLAREGYNVAKYVPYGPVRHVLPYLMRRVEENTSVSGQTGRELSLIIKELKRRRNHSHEV